MKPPVKYYYSLKRTMRKNRKMSELSAVVTSSCMLWIQMQDNIATLGKQFGSLLQKDKQH
jgi:hypothetical protein